MKGFPLRGSCRVNTRLMRCSSGFCRYTSSTAIAVPIPLEGKAHYSKAITERSGEYGAEKVGRHCGR